MMIRSAHGSYSLLCDYSQRKEILNQHRWVGYLRYEASGSTQWDSTMDVRKRPKWLQKSENKTFQQKHPRHATPPTTVGEVEHENEGDDDHATVVDVPVTVDLSIWDYQDPDMIGGNEQLTQFEVLKQKQQVRIGLIVAH